MTNRDMMAPHQTPTSSIHPRLHPEIGTLLKAIFSMKISNMCLMNFTHTSESCPKLVLVFRCVIIYELCLFVCIFPFVCVSLCF